MFVPAFNIIYNTIYLNFKHADAFQILHKLQAHTNKTCQQHAFLSIPWSNSSPVACTTTEARLSPEWPSPAEFNCFDLRCYVQPMPIITAAMMQHLAADVSDDNTSACVQTDNAAAPCQKMTELADANASVSCHQTGSVTMASPHRTMITPKKLLHERTSICTTTFAPPSATAKKRKIVSLSHQN
jgi:hypothetical protein